MELKQAREIVKTLADGIHPVTGEILPAEDSCNQPEVIRALHAVLDAIPGDGEINPCKPKKPAENGRRRMTSICVNYSMRAALPLNCAESFNALIKASQPGLSGWGRSRRERT